MCMYGRRRRDRYVRHEYAHPFVLKQKLMIRRRRDKRIQLLRPLPAACVLAGRSRANCRYAVVGIAASAGRATRLDAELIGSVMSLSDFPRG